MRNQWFDWALFWKETKDVIIHPVKYFETIRKEGGLAYPFFKGIIYMGPIWIVFVFPFFFHAAQSLGINSTILKLLTTFGMALALYAINFFAGTFIFMAIALIFDGNTNFEVNARVLASLFIFHNVYLLGYFELFFIRHLLLLLIFALSDVIIISYLVRLYYLAITKGLKAIKRVGGMHPSAGLFVLLILIGFGVDTGISYLKRNTKIMDFIWKNEKVFFSMFPKNVSNKFAKFIEAQEKSTFKERGDSFMREGKYEDAVVMYGRAIEVDNHNSSAWFAKARALYKLKKFDEAFETMEKELAIQRDFFKSSDAARNNKPYPGLYEIRCEAYILNGKGLQLDDQKKYKESEDYFKRALELRPQDPAIIFNLASVYADENNKQAAIENLTKAIGLDKKFADIAFAHPSLFANIENMPKYKALIAPSAEKSAIAALDSLKGKAGHFSDSADTYMKSRKYDKALLLYDEAIKIYPASEVVWKNWYNKGKALYGLKRYREAAESYDKAINDKYVDQKSKKKIENDKALALSQIK